MDKRFLVFDIETIPDWELVRQVFHLPADAPHEMMQEQLLAKYTSGFAPPPFHVPVCIALIDVHPDAYTVQKATVLEGDEKTLLQNFWKITRARRGADGKSMPVKTNLIHFNGRSFDLPVLFFRSLKHRVQIAQWDRKRFTVESMEDKYVGSYDVCDDLADYGAVSRSSLNVASKLIGLPGKTEIDGSQIEDLHARGEMERIKDYCIEDALATYLLWITIRFTRGEISADLYNEAFQSGPGIVRDSRTRNGGSSG